MLKPLPFSPPFPSNTMPLGDEPEPNSITEWFLPSLLDEPYDPNEINSYPWFEQTQPNDQFQDHDHDLINTPSSSLTTIQIPPPSSDSPKKKKQPNNSTSKPSQQRRRNRSATLSDDNGVEEEEPPRKLARKPSGRSNSTAHNNNSGGNNNDSRWAEQLLNPCASAIVSGNLSRVQHLLYVIHELESLSGDANHRLAAYGLRALTHHLSPSASGNLATFISTEPRTFQASLLKFHENSPWFSFPNQLANSSILQTLTSPGNSRPNLHIIDIGVSHGVQWPTMLEPLARRTGGPPPLVRLTVVGSNGPSAAFAAGTPTDDFPSRLLRFAKKINLNLQIDRIDGQQLQNLTSETLGVSRDDETLVICAQFRLHQLNHEGNGCSDDRTQFLQRLRDLGPDLVVLSENEMDCSCSKCGDFATGFSRRVEFLRRFLDSTSVAFKGRECEERRVMEAEAASALVSASEMNEGKEKWCERMRKVGFVTEEFGEDAMDGGKALLRKHDSNWETRADEKGCASLCWRRQPVSFCSLWKLPPARRKAD